MGNKSGITAARLREEVLAGIRLYDLTGLAPPDALLEDGIRSAEDRVERDLDLLISPRQVHCVADQTEPADPADTRIILPPLRIPSGWFDGHRQGAVKLPKNPVRRILTVKVRPYGYGGAPAELVDLSTNVRVQRGLLQFVPGPNGLLFRVGSLANLLAAPGMGYPIPGGLEVTYEAGITARELANDYALVLSMVRLAAAAEALTFVQAWVTKGITKEAVVQDALQHSKEFGNRNGSGPLGGEIKAFNAQYETLLRSARANAMTFAWLG